jgi:hypothetical protein
MEEKEIENPPFPFLIVRSSGSDWAEDMPHLLFPLTNQSKVCFSSAGEMDISQSELDSKIFLLQWLRELWIIGLNSEYQGWAGTLINVDEESEVSGEAANEKIMQIKGTYVLCLELFYHLRTISNSSETNETLFLRNFLEIMISEDMNEVLIEHYSLLGLYFYLRRTMTYEGFQFLGNLSPTIRSDCMSSGDICRDFIHGIDGYFGTLLVWKLIGITAEGATIALSKKYEELMEIYFRIKCYLSAGLIKRSDQSNWKSVYDLICRTAHSVHSSSQRSRYIAHAVANTNDAHVHVHAEDDFNHSNSDLSSSSSD